MRRKHVAYQQKVNIWSERQRQKVYKASILSKALQIHSKTILESRKV